MPGPWKWLQSGRATTGIGGWSKDSLPKTSANATRSCAPKAMWPWMWLATWQGAISTIVLGSLFGTVYAVFLMVSGRAGRKDAIPFGPFLSAGALVNLFGVVTLDRLVLF